MVQWLRIFLSMQGTRVRSQVWEGPDAVVPLSLHATTTEPVLRNKKQPPQSEACAPQ